MTRDFGEEIRVMYRNLYHLYGPQGWWPLLEHEGSNPTKTGSVNGYHPMNYDLPETDRQVYEVILGTILTQNTAWTAAEMALQNLNSINGIDPERLLNLDVDVLKELIRCAGFLNQKAEYLRQVTKFYVSLKGEVPDRQALLNVKGVGNETADSILLYAYKQTEFVVDTYTKRILLHRGIISEKESYGKVKTLFESNLTEDHVVYNEFHALIVEHGKRYYSKKPYAVDDPLLKG